MSLRAVLEARPQGKPPGLICVGVGALSIQRLEGSRFVRGGRYGISIDFGLEVIEKQRVCGAIFKSKFIHPTIKPKLTIASS